MREFGYVHFHNYRFFRPGEERDDCMLFVTLRGTPRIWHGDAAQDEVRGSVTLFLYGEDHRYEAEDWEYFFFHFHPGRSLLAALRHAGVEHGTSWPAVLAEAELGRMQEIFAYPTIPAPLAKHQCATMVERLLLSCITPTTPAMELPHHTRLQAITEYLQIHYAAPHTVAKLAAMVHLSPSYFAHLFRAEHGVPVLTYLRQLRMRQAEQLLRSTDLTAAEIGALVGYAQPHHFYAAFKAVTGMRPSQFRIQYRSIADESS